MTRHKQQAARARLLRSLYIWHRYLGLTTALFVIILAVTGLLLNHTGELALDTRHVRSNTMLDWYGIHAPEDLYSFALSDVTLSAAGRQVYWNTTPIPATHAPLIGAIEFADLVVLGIEGELLLFTPEGDLVERMGGAAGVPAGMQSLGIAATGELVIRAAHGYYLTDANLLQWREVNAVEATWASATEPAPTLRRALQQAWRGSGLPLERVLLDIHSGRILGSWGVYLMDTAAILFLLLAASGLWLWGRRRASVKAHHRSREQHRGGAS